MMKKNQKIKIIELLDTLHDACQELKKQKEERFIDLCYEMQNFTAGIYSFIGKILGQEHSLVKSLEGFYKQLYLTSQEQLSVKQLLKDVHNLKSIAKSLIVDKFEVAFFCYKASMSDCFESVYFAAKQDPSCDAYFIPIPYFDRNPDGSFGSMHLEGVGYYSDKYELIDWQKYDVEARRPDVIFIMNPYDDCNLVTSVHPNFYSQHLKSLTDCLVYIDYGLPLWIFKKPSKYEHFIKGWFNVDVFCTYSKEYANSQKFAMKSVCNNLSTEIVPLGSPKFDKVINSKREDFILPKEWQKIINNRRVVLFNTSLGSILKDSEEYLDKLTEILKIFSESGVALWWRPHPLSYETFESMRPGLISKYKYIVNKYKNDGWGIYDESTDLHRAISYSDAYYGDESSLVYLYCATGKPFTICGNPHQSYFLTENTDSFERTLEWRMYNMRNAKGANIDNYNGCMWWGNFYEDLDYKKFLNLFLDYIVNTDKYPCSEEYKNLQIKIFKDFVVNSDGTAGKKIYEFVKKKFLNVVRGENDVNS